MLKNPKLKARIIGRKVVSIMQIKLYFNVLDNLGILFDEIDKIKCPIHHESPGPVQSTDNANGMSEVIVETCCVTQHDLTIRMLQKYKAEEERLRKSREEYLKHQDPLFLKNLKAKLEALICPDHIEKLKLVNYAPGAFGASVDYKFCCQKLRDMASELYKKELGS